MTKASSWGPIMWAKSSYEKEMTIFSWGGGLFLACMATDNRVTYTSWASLCSPPTTKSPTIYYQLLSMYFFQFVCEWICIFHVFLIEFPYTMSMLGCDLIRWNKLFESIRNTLPTRLIGRLDREFFDLQNGQWRLFIRILLRCFSEYKVWMYVIHDSIIFCKEHNDLVIPWMISGCILLDDLGLVYKISLRIVVRFTDIFTVTLC